MNVTERKTDILGVAVSIQPAGMVDCQSTYGLWNSFENSLFSINHNVIANHIIYTVYPMY